MIQSWLSSVFHKTESPEKESPAKENPAKATAALLVLAALADREFSPPEEASLHTILQTHFGLPEEERNDLIRVARERVESSVELFTFVREAKKSFSSEERKKVVEMLWEVILADQKISQDESHFMRRLVGLLQVSDRESAKARQRAQQKAQQKVQQKA